MFDPPQLFKTRRVAELLDLGADRCRRACSLIYMEVPRLLPQSRYGVGSIACDRAPDILVEVRMQVS